MSSTLTMIEPHLVAGEFDPREWVINKFYRRIRKRNLNAIVGFFGPTGTGKSYSMADFCETISEVLGLPFDIENIHFSVKDWLHHINQRPKRGTIIALDDAETDINNQRWWTEAAYGVSLVGASSRYRGYVYPVTAPDSGMLTGQFRQLFHMWFDMQRVDLDRKLAFSIPRQPYRDFKTGKIRGKHPRAILPDGGIGVIQEVAWRLPRHAIGMTWDEYEDKKDAYMSPLYERLEEDVRYGRKRPTSSTVRVLKRLAQDHPDWSQEQLGSEVGLSREYVNRLLRSGV